MNINIFVISFVVAFAIPILIEFVVMLARSSAYSPSKNIVAFTNFQWFRNLFKWSYEGRRNVSPLTFFITSLLISVNVFAMGLALSAFGDQSPALAKQKLSYAYLFFILSSGCVAALYIENSKRINLSEIANNLLSGLASFSLLFAGLALGGNTMVLNILNIVLLLLAQPLLSRITGSWFESKSTSSLFESVVKTSNRIALNVLLMAAVFDFIDSSMGRELLFLSLVLAFIFEVSFRFVSFDVPKTKPKQEKSFIRKLLIAVIIVSAVKVLI